MKVIERDMCSVKAYIDQHCADMSDIHDSERLISVDQLPPNQRVQLLNLYEEVADLVKDKQTSVDSLLYCLQSADVAYKVCL